MYAPQLYDLEVSRDTIQEFKGYNHNLRIADNEFFDMQNLTGKYYPVLSPRGKRGTYLENTPVSGIIGKDQLVTIRDNTVYYGDKAVSNSEGNTFTLTGEHNDRQLISMGAYVIIFPDMQYLNTADLNDHGSCYSDKFTFKSTKTTLRVFGEDGKEYNVLDAVWAENLFPASDYYIDPTAQESYALFGIPPLAPSSAGTGFGESHNSISYTAYRQIFDPIEIYGSEISLFSIEYNQESGKTELRPTNPSNYDKAVERLYELTKDGKEITLGQITIDIKFYDNLRFSRKVALKLKQDTVKDEQSKRNKFYRTTIKIGDRRIKGEDITKSQICIDTRSTPESTYNTPSCWRDEHTKVRITTNSDFVNKLQKIFDNNEAHIITLTGTKTDENDPLLTKYAEGTTNIAKDNVTIVSGTEIDVLGYLDFYTTPLEGSISIDITPLDMKLDYLIECNNRLWGCRYGLNYKGDFVNEIYASERGSFRSFFKFDRTADDSYVLSLGSGGAFTGAATLGGMPVFFKEGYCHIISGSYPSTYHLTTETGTWVASGSSKSICLADSMLYFHGKDGIYVYDGASKQKISDALGNERYKNAVGGFVGGKYYVSMQDSAGKYNLFVFDQTTGMWHKEDSTQARFFAPYSGDLYMVVNDTILTLNGSQGVSEGDVEWYAETGKIGFATPDSKYIGKLQLKMILPVGSSLQVYVQYDSDGYWEYKGPVVGLNSVCFYLPIMPRKCDHFAIRLSGKGDCKIFSITKTYEAGGEM